MDSGIVIFFFKTVLYLVTFDPGLILHCTFHIKVTQSPAGHKTDEKVRLGKGWVGRFVEALIDPRKLVVVPLT